MDNYKQISVNEIYARGWTKEKLEAFFPKYFKSLLIHPESTVCEKDIIRKEKYLSFKNFTNLKDFKEKIENLSIDFEKGTISGIDFVSKLNKGFDYNCLMNNLNNYNLLSNIEHYPNGKDFDKESSFSLFTDGCFKSIGSKSFASCGGWIIDNNSQKIVFEFSHYFPLEDNEILSTFEILGISAGIKFIEKLGIKNVNCYTDSSPEAKTISYAIKNFGKQRYNDIPLYEELVEILKKTNSSISWIPREYNQHADNLTKVSFISWKKNHQEKFVDNQYFDKNGYELNPDKEIFFFHKDLNISNLYSVKNENIVIYDRFKLNEEPYEGFYFYDKEALELKEISFNKVYYSYINSDLSMSDKNKKIRDRRLEKIIEYIEVNNDGRDITFCLTHGELSIFNKHRPIPGDQQEVYFNLHKAITNFKGNLTIIDMTEDMTKKIAKTHKIKTSSLSKKNIIPN